MSRVVYTESKMATAKLECVPLEKDGLQPLVVQFTNGSLKAGRKGKNKDGVEFSYYRWKDSADIRKKHRRTLTAKTDHMEYVGQNFGQFARVNNLCKYLVGVLDKETGKMKIYDSQVFMMQPKVLEKAAASSPDDTVDGKKELSFTEKSDRLTEAFGSSKKKRAVASRKKNVIDKDDLDTTVMDAVQGELANLSKEEQKTPSSEQSSTIPPFNIKAETPSEVYNLDDIITPMEYDVLKNFSKELEGANRELIDQWRKEKRFPEYILKHLAVMPLDSSQRTHRSCLLLYLSYMIKMYQLNSKALRKKDPLQGYPDKIQERLLSMFTLENPNQSSNARLVPKRLKDRLLSYILVLALFIDEFILDCMVIAKDLKMDPKKLSNHLRALGCAIETSGTSRKRKADEASQTTETRTARLKVPLPPNFPNIGIR